MVYQDPGAALNPSFDGMHTQGARVPREDPSAMLMTFRSDVLAAHYPTPAYGRWLATCDMRPAYRYHRLVLQLFLQLGHPVLHLLDLAQHLHRVFHSETSFTRVTRPSNRRTTSRTNGSSSGLATLAGRPASAVDSFSR